MEPHPRDGFHEVWDDQHSVFCPRTIKSQKILHSSSPQLSRPSWSPLKHIYQLNHLKKLLSLFSSIDFFEYFNLYCIFSTCLQCTIIQLLFPLLRILNNLGEFPCVFTTTITVIKIVHVKYIYVHGCGRNLFVLDNNRSEHSFVRREHFQISKADESLKRGLIF